MKITNHITKHITKYAIYIAVISLPMLNSCGTKPVNTKYGSIEMLSAKKITAKSNETNPNPEYLSSNMKIKFKSNSNKATVVVKVRMQTDSIIWLNVSYMGFPVARGILTQNSIKYYDRYNKQYFSGDYSVVKELLGTELSFNQIQNLFLGKPIVEVTKKYKSSINENSYLLKNNRNSISKNIWFNPINFNLEKQSIGFNKNSKSLKITNNNFKLIDGKYNLPSVINLEIIHESTASVLIENRDVKTKTISSFPFKIPSNYTETSHTKHN
ncbi:MAG: DUF4292 domain-containing protein [Ichthyobacteriaceae bacterium]|nr:DUF4292 domain-containing protein [Ichthyobacteriaceae bacterium]